MIWIVKSKGLQSEVNLDQKHSVRYKAFDGDV